MELIDKADVVAEIEKIYNDDYKFLPSDLVEGVQDFKDGLLAALNSLEVNKVDLEKEIEEVKHNYKVDDNRHTSICSADIEWIAEHFFELGLKAKKGGGE